MSSATGWIRCVALGLLCAVGVDAHAQSFFNNGFEQPFNIPTSDAEAARFLNQASFGASSTAIATLRSQGLENWLNQQVGLTPTLARPFLETITVNENNAGLDLSQSYRIQRWFDTAVTASDQLRQKVAYALSQMIVVSDLDAGLSQEPIMMAEWNDLLVRNALGNFRTLLGEVTRSPMMGRYLTHLRNRKFEITPRCYDQLPPLSDDTNINTPGLEYHDCSTTSATNNGTMTPRIAVYNLPTGGLVAPDENYAREVMQLFSIGLIERNADFSPTSSPATPTYSQTTITTLSRVMTGLSYACSGARTVSGVSAPRTCNCTGTDCSFQTGNFFSTPPSIQVNLNDGLVHPDRYEPMICYPRYHDTGRDRIGFQLPGTTPTDPVGAAIQLAPNATIPGGTPDADKSFDAGDFSPPTLFDEVDPGLPRTSAVNCDSVNTASSQSLKDTCLNYCNNELSSALDRLFNEPNTATMVARQLIQRLVSSNPSPAYIARVTAVFANNGSGVRGDLLATVRAVLLDDEARTPPGSAGLDVNAGKPREPLLKLVQVWRALGAISGDTRADGYRRWTTSTTVETAYNQRPLGAPSVFNFYEPDYKAPGNISTLNLFSPEFQIINESSSITTANDLYTRICAGHGSGNNCHAALVSPPPADRAYFPDAALDGLPGGACGTSCTASDDVNLIEALNVRLLGGSMSGAIGDTANPANTTLNTGMKGTLFRLLGSMSGTFGEAIAQNARRREILYLIHLVAISPEFSTIR